MAAFFSLFTFHFSPSMAVHLFGIRHHGPGSARSLLQALDELRPDAVLVEGPPDGESVLPLLAHPEMKPPVALLIYQPDAPRCAVHYPFAVFSPEWQALHYALRRKVAVRFIDLPQTHQLALQAEREIAARAPLFDHILPPTLAVVVTGGFGQITQRIKLNFGVFGRR